MRYQIKEEGSKTISGCTREISGQNKFVQKNCCKFDKMFNSFSRYCIFNKAKLALMAVSECDH